MDENSLINCSNNRLEFKHIKIKGVDKIGDYLFISLDNGQKILTNGKELYDVSEYRHLFEIFTMENKLCAVFKKGISICVVDLKTMEILYEDKNAYHVSKQDERTLHIIMKIGAGNKTIYDIKTKKYLPVPDKYEFEHSLGNNLYVFREEGNFDTNFYDYKRCVINADGKTLLENIEGWIYLSGNHLIIIKKNELSIVGISEESTVEMQTIKQTGNIITKPAYYEGNIVIVEKEAIKIYTPSLELINEIKIAGLETILDHEIVSDTLKLCLPHTINGKQINKHLYVNLKTGKAISHIRIEPYPYWIPTTYIGQDSIDSGVTDYYFYDTDFNPIICVSANSYESVDSPKEHLFIIRTENDNGENRQFLNTENGSIKDILYDYIHFHYSSPYGYGVNLTAGTIDFFDENLNIVIPNFNYKKLNFNYNGLKYFVVNDYVCIIRYFVDEYGRNAYRNIIQKATGEIVLDSFNHECFEVGDFIQIIGPNDTQFLNTKTGEIGALSLTAPSDERGTINFKEINDIKDLFAIESDIQLLLPSLDDRSNPKEKKLKPGTKKDDLKNS